MAGSSKTIHKRDYSSIQGRGQGRSNDDWELTRLPSLEGSTSVVPASATGLWRQQLAVSSRRLRWAQVLVKAGPAVLAHATECSEVPIPKAGRRKRRYKAVQVRKGAEREFDVLDTMNCLHVEFRCQRQAMPVLPGVPQMELSSCNVGTLIVVEAARIIAVYQGCGFLRENVQWIQNPDRKLVTTWSISLAYAFFNDRCMHVTIMASLMQRDGIMRHARVPGWTCDIVHIIEIGWRLAKDLT
ncbi:unnamed protein product [Nippostrongylus brasiliensis]|uniref:RNase H domain-containing protein n=1 Tax=Nippostrongylus brasiliensis TaxID=27835 RepID=A0A0N4YV07_NIPBR|nr:unnamed protein product [Nippostrongylus brasiliensis]